MEAYWPFSAAHSWPRKRLLSHEYGILQLSRKGLLVGRLCAYSSAGKKPPDFRAVSFLIDSSFAGVESSWQPARLTLVEIPIVSVPRIVSVGI
jgi:hypothetical protein